MPERPPYRLAVKAAILDDLQRCLLLRRDPDSRHFAGDWEWPGGKVEAGEDFSDALVREVREETGLDVELTGLAGAMTMSFDHAEVILLCMEARVRGPSANQPTVRLSEEHDACAWVPIDELERWRCAPGVHTLMLDWVQRRRASET